MIGKRQFMNISRDAFMRRRFSLLLALAILTFVQNQRALGQEVADKPSIELPATDEGLPGAGPIRRYDWFRNLWLQRRSEWLKTVEADQQAVVFFGDSITQGWGAKLGGHFRDMKVANRGISGDTTRGMLIRFQADVLSLQPRGLVMLMGTNDLEEGATPETIAGNLQLILQACQAHSPEMPVILCLVFPSSETKKRPADKIQAMNQLYQKVAREFDQVTVLDTWTLFADENGDAKLAEFPDLLHPNQAGYLKWSNALIPLLETAELLKAPEQEFQLEPGFRSLFNGKDLSGWGYRPTPEPSRKRKPNPNAPLKVVIQEAEDFEGKVESSDWRYIVRQGRLVVSTPKEGRRIQQIWTNEEFPQDFVLKLEFRATPNADSGVFIRHPQLQCRDYLLAGPYKELKQYRQQDWNELVIEVQGGTARCTCNGEVLEAEFAVPANGPIGLEGDRGQLEYRHIRISTPN